MKNLNWILHAISLIAIIFLFVQNRNCKSHCKTDSSAQNTSLISNSGTAAFFNSDSLLGQLKFFKDNEIMFKKKQESMMKELQACLLYTSDAADERSSVDLGGRRIIKKKTQLHKSEHA